MNVAERNKKAKLNGILGEQLSADLFAQLVLVNELLDAITDGRPVEIKTCQEYVKSGNQYKHGKFVLVKKQHEELVERDGLYLFVVLRENGEHYMLFLPACLVPYPTDKPLYTKTWTTIFFHRRGKIPVEKNWQEG